MDLTTLDRWFFIFYVIQMRGKQIKKRELHPDRIYNSLVVTKLINYMMQDGKKKVAESIIYQALDKLGSDLKMKPVEALEKALGNIKPKVEVRSRRVGGANYQVPVPVSEDRQLALALRWIIAAARESRGSRESWQALHGELLAAANRDGTAFKKKEDTHKMAEANKAFSHLSW